MYQICTPVEVVWKSIEDVRCVIRLSLSQWQPGAVTTKQESALIGSAPLCSQPGVTLVTLTSQWWPSQPGDEEGLHIVRVGALCVTDGVPHLCDHHQPVITCQQAAPHHTQSLSSQANPLFTLIIPKQSYSTHPDLTSQKHILYRVRMTRWNTNEKEYVKP